MEIIARVLIMLIPARQIHHAELAIIVMVPANHRHNKSHCLKLFFSLKAKDVSEIFAHFVRSPCLILIAKLDTIISFLGSFGKISHIATMLSLHIITTQHYNSDLKHKTILCSIPRCITLWLTTIRYTN